MERSELSRVNAFTDGVMAVAITLLVLNIEVPEAEITDAAELWRRLGDLAPDALAYAISFWLIGRFWVLHHRLFARLRAVDGRLLALNLLSLALIALMPFATSLLGRHGDLAPADVVFAGVLALAALTHRAMVVYCGRAGLEREPGALQEVGRGISIAVLFLASIPVAFLSTIAAQAIWVAAIFVPHRGRTP
jgi:uncharacterized membrane protein